MRFSKHTYKNRWLILLTFVSVIGITNKLAYYFPLRVDLTEDKRYSLHSSTKALLSRLESELQVNIYLAGDLPNEFKQLQTGVIALLEEFKAYARCPVTYRVVDLSKEPADKRKEILKKLVEKKIEPTNLYRQAHGKRIENIIYPGAILSYQRNEVGVMMLKANKMTPTNKMVSQSIENLEYEFTSSLAKLVDYKNVKIGLIKGHGEPNTTQLQGLSQALEELYEVHNVMLSQVFELSNYAALLITKPQQSFTESEKYVLDQYIMQGGKVLFFLDRLKINMDNLASGNSIALPLELNLDDQLFRYGVRINPDLIKDLQAGVYPIIVGKMGNQPQLKLLPWPFFPIINNFSNHLITKNINAIYTQFISSIDIVKVEGVIQTPLLYSSPYSLKAITPVYVDLESLRRAPDTDLYKQGPIPLACLLEGKFNSLYKNRMPPKGIDATQFLAVSQPTKILVVASGSIVLNAVSPKDQQALPWGYDPFLQQSFANQDFVLSVLAYMLEESGVINAKHKTIKLRLLDNLKVARERLYWQLLNVVIPIFMLGFIGIFWHIVRRKRYRVKI
ncbi:MAG: gliding motility-associated ABC transporter substrate-binding protein GldG [Candidatus Amoebophilus sp.]